MPLYRDALAELADADLWIDKVIVPLMDGRSELSDALRALWGLQRKVSNRQLLKAAKAVRIILCDQAHAFATKEAERIANLPPRVITKQDVEEFDADQSYGEAPAYE